MYKQLNTIDVGVGISMIMVSLIVSIYYNVIIGYTIYYMAASLTSELPWNKCQSWWGADQFCFSRSARNNETSTYYDIDEKILYYNGTRVCGSGSFGTPCVNVTLQTAARQYWECVRKMVLSDKCAKLIIENCQGNTS